MDNKVSNVKTLLDFYLLAQDRFSGHCEAHPFLKYMAQKSFNIMFFVFTSVSLVQ